MMNLFHNLDFIFGDGFTFADRFPPEEEQYFSGKGKLWGRKLEVNFVPNVRDIQLYDWKERGAGGRNVNFELAGNVMGSHISVSGGPLQESPSPWPGRPRHHFRRARLLSALAPKRRNDPRRLETGVRRGTAQSVVSSAFQLRR
jgi:hypothetical protein